MRARQSEVIEAAHQVQAFLDAHTDVVGPSIASARQNLDDAVAQLTAMAVTQTGSAIAAKDATARQKALRANLRNNYMKPVTTVAKLLLPDVPEIAALDVKTTTMTTPQLVAAAHAMADAAMPYAATFTAHGLPESFPADLRAQADAVTTSVTGRQQAQVTTSSAVQGLTLQTSRVRTLLTLINALVVPKLGTNATLLAAWKAARAITGAGKLSPVPASIGGASTSTASTGSAVAASGTPTTATSTAAPSAAAATPTATPVTSAAAPASPSDSSTAAPASA